MSRFSRSTEGYAPSQEGTLRPRRPEEHREPAATIWRCAARSAVVTRVPTKSPGAESASKARLTGRPIARVEVAPKVASKAAPGRWTRRELGAPYVLTAVILRHPCARVGRTVHRRCATEAPLSSRSQRRLRAATRPGCSHAVRAVRRAGHPRPGLSSVRAKRRAARRRPEATEPSRYLVRPHAPPTSRPQ